MNYIVVYWNYNNADEEKVDQHFYMVANTEEKLFENIQVLANHEKRYFTVETHRVSQKAMECYDGQLDRKYILEWDDEPVETVDIVPEYVQKKEF